jgi:hypothetical protein
MDKILKKSFSAIALTTLSVSSMAGIELHILDEAKLTPSAYNNRILTPEVANDGTILSSSGEDEKNRLQQKWHKTTGYMPLPEPARALYGKTFSNDGTHALLMSLTYNDNFYYYTPDDLFRIGNPAYEGKSISQMSGNGRLLVAEATYQDYINFWYDGVDSSFVFTPMPEGNVADLVNSWGINDKGDRFLVTRSNGSIKEAHFIDFTGLDNDLSNFSATYTKIPYEFKTVLALSDDGHSVLGTISNFSANCDVSNVVYSDSAGIKEIGCSDEFTLQGFSGDGSKVIGNKGDFNGPVESYIWDAINGTRNFRDILHQSGNNIDNWQSLKVADISEDGLKVTGVSTDSLGDQYIFMMEVVSECTADF